MENNSEFIGLVIGLIYEKRPSKDFTLSDMAKFLAEKSLVTKESIFGYAREILERRRTNEDLKVIYGNMKEIFDNSRNLLFEGMTSDHSYQTSEVFHG